MRYGKKGKSKGGSAVMQAEALESGDAGAPDPSKSAEFARMRTRKVNNVDRMRKGKK